jgi:hypothetical protein
MSLHNIKYSAKYFNKFRKINFGKAHNIFIKKIIYNKICFILIIKVIIIIFREI